MSIDILDIFAPSTANWFKKSLGFPTEVQKEAWPAIKAGGHVLVSAPTGTGKTLSAFLVFIDELKRQERAGTLKQELHLIYISPLKSLAGDIRENLRRPLEGISGEELNMNSSFNEDTITGSTSNLSIAIRTGDTTQSERRKMIKTPPHILITTPESLYLLLTSKSGQTLLSTAKAIIIDELHALIDTKRGAHLMLSIARLDTLCPKPLQRIGLSATIKPLEIASKYLAPEAVAIISPDMKKEIKLLITSPINKERRAMKEPVWEELAKLVYEHCIDNQCIDNYEMDTQHLSTQCLTKQHLNNQCIDDYYLDKQCIDKNELSKHSINKRSVIAFTEGRRYAEKLAYYVNQLGGEGFARTHHGSLSKEQRLEVESDLREGRLRLLCATSSMELGIDVGEVDQVLQIGCPRSISSTMQRLGRAGHKPGSVSIMYIFPRADAEGLYCGLTAQVARDGGIEDLKPPVLCLDILAQHLVSMAAFKGYYVKEVEEVLKRAYPFYTVTLEDVRSVLCMLAGDYEHEKDLPARPRILYDRIHDYVEGDTYSRMLAISAGGTIPDRGLYTAKNEMGVKLGELDEEFIFESRIGDKFLLGTFAWQIKSIQKDVVIVAQTASASARLPFWKGEIKGRRMQTGIAFGSILHQLFKANELGRLYPELKKLGLDDTAAKGAEEYIKRQIAATGILPDERTILIEHFRDEAGNEQLMIHSLFGRQVNAPLAILAREAAIKRINMNIGFVEEEDGFLLYPYSDCNMPQGLLYDISPEAVRPVLEAVLLSTPLFNMAFRYNAARALMMGVRNNKRQPLWIQRMRSTQMLESIVSLNNHPLIRETKRECLNDYWDIPGVEYVLNGIRSGGIRVQEVYLDTPSPMSLILRQQTEAAMMYDYAPTTFHIQNTAKEALEQVQMIPPDEKQLEIVSKRSHLPEDEKQLHSLLMIEGDLVAGDLEVPVEWLELLAKRNQAVYIEPGLWIAKEQEEEYNLALEQAAKEEIFKGMFPIVRRYLRYKGGALPEELSERYLLSGTKIGDILIELCRLGDVIESEGYYYHARLYKKAQKETVKNLRKQVKTMPSERYAALLVNHYFINALPMEQLEMTLKLLVNQSYPLSLWESIIFPAHVNNYRPELLDTLLSRGNFIWHITEEKELVFHQNNDIDWDFDLREAADTLGGNEKIIYEALQKRGASFMERLAGLIEGSSPFDILLSLAEKGVVCADSFQPVRWILNSKKLEKSTARQRISAKVKAGTVGRWELIRPLVSLTTEEELERIFDRVFILCKETCQGMSWASALEVLRIWEYTGRVRRGYFIEGLSGIQFIRDKDYSGIVFELEKPREEIFWLSALDPAQQWGKCLPHLKGKEFINVAGSAVALGNGIPVMIFERQGKVLRVFDTTLSEENFIDILQAFIKEFERKRIFPGLNRLIIKEYPKEAEEPLSLSGFRKEIQDYVLYRI